MSESDLIKGVRGWMEKQGYPLEMRVAQAFEAQNFGVEQSHYYAVEDEPARELDVLAWYVIEDPRLLFSTFPPRTPAERSAYRDWVNDTQRPVTHVPSLTEERDRAKAKAWEKVLSVDVGVVIECKSGPPGQVWVAFTSVMDPAPLAERLIAYATSDLAYQSLIAIDDSQGGCFDLFQDRPRYAYAVTPAWIPTQRNAQPAKEWRDENGYDAAYSAINKVAAASRHMVEVHDSQHGKRRFRFAVPTVVTSLPLVECWLDGSAVKIEEVDHVLVRHTRPNRLGRSLTTVVHVVQERALPTFVGKIRDAMKVVHEKFEIVETEIPKRPGT